MWQGTHGPAEAGKWDHLEDIDVSVIVGDKKTRIAALNHPAMVYVINRENVKFLVEYYEKNGLRWDFDAVIIDELSSFKNHQSQRFKWLRKVRPFVKRMIGLTGTANFQWTYGSVGGDWNPWTVGNVWGVSSADTGRHTLRPEA